MTIVKEVNENEVNENTALSGDGTAEKEKEDPPPPPYYSVAGSKPLPPADVEMGVNNNPRCEVIPIPFGQQQPPYQIVVVENDREESCCCTCCPRCIAVYDIITHALDLFLNFMVLISFNTEGLKRVCSAAGIAVDLVGIQCGWKLLKATDKTKRRDARRNSAQTWIYFNTFLLAVGTFLLLIPIAMMLGLSAGLKFLPVWTQERVARTRYNSYSYGSDEPDTQNAFETTSNAIDKDQFTSAVIITLFTVLLIPLGLRTLFQYIVKDYMKRI